MEGDDTHANTTSRKRERELCAANVWGAIPTPEQERRASDLPPGLHGGRGGRGGLNVPRGLTGGRGANAVTRPDSGGSRWPGRRQAESRRRRGGNTALPCLQGGLGVQRAPFPPRVRRRWRSPSLQGRHSLRAARGARAAKGPRQQKQRPSPGYREVAQRKASGGTPKVPAPLLRDRAPETGRSLCPECLSRGPSAARRRSPLLFSLTLASPFRTTPLLSPPPAAAEEGGHG